MRNTKSSLSMSARWGCALMIAAAVTGCTTPTASKPPKAPAVEAPPPPPPRDPAKEKEALTRELARLALDEGTALYDSGDYSGAIRRLSASPDIPNTDVPIRVQAMKIIAFSYCLTRRPALCREQFENILALDANFDLAPAEKGHPSWGPVFEKVKKAQAGK